MSEALHVELRELIRRLDIEDRKLSLMRQQALALREGIRNLYADGLGGSDACLTGIQGSIINPDGVLIPRSSVRFVGAHTGTDYGTFVTTGGDFDVALLLDPADLSQLNTFVWGPGARFDSNPSAFTLIGPTRCRALNPQGAIFVPTPAAGYQWTNNSLGWGCLFPLKNTISFTDSVIGSGTATGTTNWTGSCLMGTTIAAGSCASVATAVRTVFTQSLNVSWFYRNGVSCPVAQTCTAPVFNSAVGGTQTIASKTEPDENTLFDMTFNIAAGTERLFHGAAASTFRMYET